jgi:hypothetical protein
MGVCNGSQQLLCIDPRAKRHGKAYEKKETCFASERGVYYPNLKKKWKKT